MVLGFSLAKMSYEGSYTKDLDCCFDGNVFQNIWCFCLHLHKFLEVVFYGFSLILLALKQIHGSQGFTCESLKIC